MTTPIPENATIPPSQSRHGKTCANLTIGAMVFEGLYWQGIAGLQLLVVFSPDTDSNLRSTLTLTALRNLAVFNRGVAYASLHENDKAVADFRKGLESSNAPELRQQAQAGLKWLGANRRREAARCSWREATHE